MILKQPLVPRNTTFGSPKQHLILMKTKSPCFTQPLGPPMEVVIIEVFHLCLFSMGLVQVEPKFIDKLIALYFREIEIGVMELALKNIKCLFYIKLLLYFH